MNFEKLLSLEDWTKEKTPEEILDYTLSIGHNSFYVGYSGGKDSGIVLNLVATKYPNFFKGVIYVDTGIGTDDTKNFVIQFCKEKNYPNVKCIVMKKNEGYSFGNNLHLQ